MHELCTHDRMSRSFYGVIPHKDFIHEKVSGITSSFLEPKSNRILKHYNIQNNADINDELSLVVKDHFHTIIESSEYPEHCLVINVKNKKPYISYEIVYDTSTYNSVVSDIQNVIGVIVVHFLPKVAANQYEECSSLNYNISFSNKMTYDGNKFIANLRIQENEFPRSFSASLNKTFKDHIEEMKNVLEKRFDKVTTLTTNSGKSVKGFTVYFNKMNRVNILKLINIDLTYSVNVVSSLSGMGIDSDKNNNGDIVNEQ